MDYLIVLFLSLLSPVALHLSNVDYITETGITFSDPVHTGGQKATSIATGVDQTGSSVVSTDYFGSYGITYDTSFDYKFYVSDSTWLALKASYAPVREGSQVVVQPNLSTTTVPLAFYYTEHPTFGILAGYDYKKVSPYFGASFARVAYSSYSNFEIEEQFDSTIIYNAGIRYKFDSHWSGVAEMEAYKIAMRYIVGQSYDVDMRVIKYKFGVLYSFIKQKDIIENNKDQEYKDIIRSLDPTIDAQIEQKKANEIKQKQMAKEKAKQEKIAKQKAQKKQKEDNQIAIDKIKMAKDKAAKDKKALEKKQKEIAKDKAKSDKDKVKSDKDKAKSDKDKATIEPDTTTNNSPVQSTQREESQDEVLF